MMKRLWDKVLRYLGIRVSICASCEHVRRDESYMSPKEQYSMAKCAKMAVKVINYQSVATEIRYKRAGGFCEILNRDGRCLHYEVAE